MWHTLALVLEYWPSSRHLSTSTGTGSVVIGKCFGTTRSSTVLQYVFGPKPYQMTPEG